ncbi:MAG TPA: PAS domain-containing sensor histidine kinase [Chryseolinea sp.]|jgi:sigma-B regulation protein RsbU (phosphoserine phosphatase)|nr:PAS domain-containing sensor histidine kinase [Chryseolinea sp.]
MENEIDAYKLLDSAPCGYVVFRDVGEIVWINTTLCSWLDYNKQELQGKSVETIFTLSTRIFYNTHFFPLLKLHAKAHEIFITLRTKNNGDIPVLVNADRDEVAGLCHSVIIPVLQRKEYEQQLLRARADAEKALNENVHMKALKEKIEENVLQLEDHYHRLSIVNKNLIQFNKIISHDLQEPIHKIQIYGDRIRSDDDSRLTTKSIKDLGRIQVAAERLRLLTKGLEEYINVNNDQELSEVQLLELLNASLAKAKANHNYDHVELIVEESIVLFGFRQQLELMFYHLFDNAIKFRQPGRDVVIRVSVLSLEENIFRQTDNHYKYSDHHRIIFEDTSEGFDMEYKDYVVQLLKKLDPITSGIGIGLGLVKKIVDNHSGMLSIESEKGRGTRVTITLPGKQHR